MSLSRDEFLALLWSDLINTPLNGAWIENTIRYAQRDPGAPFADAGAALGRLRAAGASDWDLSIVARHAAYEAVFDLLYKLDDPGVEDASVLLEGLLSADPSGLEGRPGSAEAARGG